MRAYRAIREMPLVPRLGIRGDKCITMEKWINRIEMAKKSKERLKGLVEYSISPVSIGWEISAQKSVDF